MYNFAQEMATCNYAEVFDCLTFAMPSSNFQGSLELAQADQKGGRHCFRSSTEAESSSWTRGGTSTRKICFITTLCMEYLHSYPSYIKCIKHVASVTQNEV